jgi:hypothetical protein
MKISQREARKLRKRIEELEKQEDKRGNAWSSEWPMGKCLGKVQIQADSFMRGAIHASRLLKHAVVVSENDQGEIWFHAMPLAKEEQ